MTPYLSDYKTNVHTRPHSWQYLHVEDSLMQLSTQFKFKQNNYNWQDIERNCLYIFKIVLNKCILYDRLEIYQIFTQLLIYQPVTTLNSKVAYQYISQAFIWISSH